MLLMYNYNSVSFRLFLKSVWSQPPGLSKLECEGKGWLGHTRDVLLLGSVDSSCQN